ncbi:hypothetical protein RUM43_007190 [Polyplax serrata]|uniref:Translation initiation factor eIF2B subunit delta n=1 Tax=Polyplax serrata TaxID=468196 RepID=A0AAN8P598_POLSC
MSVNSEKTREQILAERQEKKKRKANLKKEQKGKDKNVQKGNEENKSKVNEEPKHGEGGDGQANAQNKKTVEQATKSGNPSTAVTVKPPTSGSNNQEQEKNNVVEPSIQHKSHSSDVSESKGNQADGDLARNEGLVKTKAQLKAERRAKQEAERAKKLQKSLGENQEKKVVTPSKPVQATPKIAKPTALPLEMGHKVKLFAHLYDTPQSTDAVDSMESVHPSILQLRTKFSSRVVSGANACCLALLNALKKVVLDFETPPNQEFSRGLESEVTKCMQYLSKHRPAAVSMDNAVKHLKFKINQSKGNEVECKNSINEWIDTYIKEQLEMAAKAICLFVREKITSGDVILTYGWSSLIHQILISAFNEGIKFKVIVADGRPWLEGRELLKKLVNAGIQCTYVFVNGLSFVMPEVTKILLGAHALLANGYVMSRVGSSQIALLAKTYNVPVLVCCETHKFSERVQTDSFVYNELANPDDLTSNKGCLSKELSKWKTIQSLTPLNLMYDVTPPDLVSAVVTELAVLPCTSVPVILRIKPPDLAF